MAPPTPLAPPSLPPLFPPLPALLSPPPRPPCFLPFIFFPPQLLLLHLFLLLFLFSSSSQCGGLVNTTLLSLCYWCNVCRGGGASGAEEVVELHLLASRSASLEGRLRRSSGNRWSVSSCDMIISVERLKRLND